MTTLSAERRTEVLVTCSRHDFGLMPWTNDDDMNRAMMLHLANELGVTVYARDHVTDAVVMTVEPTK